MGAALGPIGIGLSALSTAFSAYGQYQAGQAAKDAGKYQNRVAKNNAILADRAAADATARGAIEESRQRAVGRLTIGSQKAAFAASGINLSSETAVDIQSSQAGLNELDALTIRANAAREAAGFQQEGANYRSEGALAKTAGQQAAYGANLAAAGTVLSGAGDVATQWYQFGGATPKTKTTRRVGGAGSSSGYFSGS